jgi:hypothetical protein
MPGEIVMQRDRFERTRIEGPDLDESALASQLSEEFLLVHAVLERFAAIDEDDRDFVVELAAKIGVRIDVDVVPGESSAPRKLGQALFHHFTQVASFAGINHDVAELWHAGRF